MSDTLPAPAASATTTVTTATTAPVAAGELDDAELDEVVGGLARVWLPAPVARPPG